MNPQLFVDWSMAEASTRFSSQKTESLSVLTLCQSVRACEGLPEKAYLSVRAGDVLGSPAWLRLS